MIVLEVGPGWPKEHANSKEDEERDKSDKYTWRSRCSLVRRAAVFLELLSGILESGPFPKGHDLLEVENQ